MKGDEVREAIKKIEDNNWIKDLRQCQSIKERLDKLMELLPEFWLWSPIPARQLVLYLQRAYRIDFGVCDFYTMERDRQYCAIDGEKIECLCAIPEAYCFFRDKDGKPKYPEFLFIALAEREEEWRDASEIIHGLSYFVEGAAE